MSSRSFASTIARLAVVLIAVAAVCARPAAAQPQAPDGRAVLTGTVVDAETGEPLPGVNVFIAVSMRGTATSPDGRFRLEVPLGAHRLYVSSVGYESEARNLNLREPRVYTFEFELQPTVIEGEEVVVEAERDEKWQERYDRFVDAFIGETPNAEQTEIQNPEVVSFDGGIGELEAFASEPLVIENQALGYRITYHLKDFRLLPNRTQYDGEPLFEEMDGTPQQEARWAAARREAFLGSFHHLLLAMIADKVEPQGFKLFLRPNAGPPSASSMPTVGSPMQMGGQRYPISVDEIMGPGDVQVEHVLDFNGVVEVVYLGEQQSEAYARWREQMSGGRGFQRRGPRYQTSQFWLERGPATIDYKGDIVDPYGVTVSGYFAFERVGDQLPKEYRPR
jgi:hypothetical protein